MVHRESSEGKKAKPRGRPFAKGNKRGKVNNDVLADSGHESGNEGGVIASAPQSSIVDPLNDGILHQLPKLVMESIDNTIKECMQTPSVEEVKQVEEVKPAQQDVLMDSMEFVNGENKLTIRFIKKHNRMFKTQVILNGDTEIRPTTFTGASPAYSFWDLLKGAMKK